MKSQAGNQASVNKSVHFGDSDSFIDVLVIPAEKLGPGASHSRKWDEVYTPDFPEEGIFGPEGQDNRKITTHRRRDRKKVRRSGCEDCCNLRTLGLVPIDELDHDYPLNDSEDERWTVHEDHNKCWNIYWENLICSGCRQFWELLEEMEDIERLAVQELEEEEKKALDELF